MIAPLVTPNHEMIDILSSVVRSRRIRSDRRTRLREFRLLMQLDVRHDDDHHIRTDAPV